MINLVELAAEDDEMELAPCAHGNIVTGHACYCHHKDGPRKCPQWSFGQPYELCTLYQKRDSNKGKGE